METKLQKPVWAEVGDKYVLSRLISENPYRAVKLKPNADALLIVAAELLNGVYGGGRHLPNVGHPRARRKRAKRLANMTVESRAKPPPAELAAKTETYSPCRVNQVYRRTIFRRSHMATETQNIQIHEDIVELCIGGTKFFLSWTYANELIRALQVALENKCWDDFPELWSPDDFGSERHKLIAFLDREMLHITFGNYLSLLTADATQRQESSQLPESAIRELELTAAKLESLWATNRGRVSQGEFDELEAKFPEFSKIWWQDWRELFDGDVKDDIFESIFENEATKQDRFVARCMIINTCYRQLDFEITSRKGDRARSKRESPLLGYPFSAEITLTRDEAESLLDELKTEIYRTDLG